MSIVDICGFLPDTYFTFIWGTQFVFIQVSTLSLNKPNDLGETNSTPNFKI